MCVPLMGEEVEEVGRVANNDVRSLAEIDEIGIALEIVLGLLRGEERHIGCEKLNPGSAISKGPGARRSRRRCRSAVGIG